MRLQLTIVFATLVGFCAQIRAQCPGKPTGKARKERPENIGDATGDVLNTIVRFRHAKTSQSLLAVDWHYPTVRNKAGTVLRRDQALAKITNRSDRRPLLVLRECTFCRGTEQALLDARKNNDKTRLLTRWFYCVKLPPEVIDAGHPLRNLFTQKRPSHVFLCDADGSFRQDFDGRQTAGALHRAMVKMIRRRYARDPLVATSEMTGMLAEFDKIDESLDLLRRRLRRATMRSTPNEKELTALRDRISTTEKRRDAKLQQVAKIRDLRLQPLMRRSAVGSSRPAGASATKPTAATKGDVDPYTGGDAATVRGAGYVTLEPKHWRKDVTERLPRAGIRWLETKHFIIGSSLKAIPMPKVSKHRRRIAAEVKRLRVRLATVPERPRVIDPWLRLHLYAERLETIYEQMQTLLGVDDGSFPTETTRHVYETDYMGQGPNLGMQGKYRVFLLQKTSDLARYYRELRGRPTGASEPLHFHHTFNSEGAMMYAICADIERKDKDPAHALRCQVIFNTGQMLLRGYRHFDFELPAWIGEGVSNYLLRRYDPNHFCVSAITGGGARTRRSVAWYRNCFKLVKNGKATSAADLCAVQQPGAFSLIEHMGSWSRIEYLATLDKGHRLAAFLSRVKAPLPRTTRSNAQFPAVLEAQKEAFADALGMTFAEFDERWSKHVLRTYRKR